MTDGINLENNRWILRASVTENGITKPEEIVIGYGKLLEAGVDFVIIGLIVFLVVKLMNSIKKKSDDPKDVSVVTPKNIELLDKIWEALEKQNRILTNKQ